MSDEGSSSSGKKKKGLLSKVKDKVTGASQDIDQVPFPRIDIRLIGCSNLNATDLGAKPKSDPYVILQIGDQKVKSNNKSGTLNPLWNKMFALPITGTAADVLEMKVMDHDLVGDSDSLGEVSAKIGDLKLKKGIESVCMFHLEGGDVGENVQVLAEQAGKTVAVEGAAVVASQKGAVAGAAVGAIGGTQVKGKVGESWSNHGVLALGLTLRESADDLQPPLIASHTPKNKAGALYCRLYAGSRLNAADVKGSDPYCIFTLGSATWKSKTKKSCNPTWNQIFDLPADAAALKGDLGLTVYDHDLIGSDDSLGTGSINLGKLKLTPGEEKFALITLEGGELGENFIKAAQKLLKKAVIDAATPGGGSSSGKEEKISNYGVVCVGLYVPPASV